jgi:hypothetical protein
MTVGLLAAMIVSSIFTVQAFLEVFNFAGINPVFSAIGSVSGFLMIDVILFFLTHFLIDLVYKPAALHDSLNPKLVIYTAFAIGIFTFIVSVASNLYFMFIGFGVMERGSDSMKAVGLIVGILLGTAPPIQSVAVGTIIAMMPLQIIAERRSWETSRQRAWSSYRTKHKLDKPLSERLERLSTEHTHIHSYSLNEQHYQNHSTPVHSVNGMNERLNGSASGYSKKHERTTHD